MVTYNLKLTFYLTKKLQRFNLAWYCGSCRFQDEETESCTMEEVVLMKKKDTCNFRVDKWIS